MKHIKVTSIKNENYIIAINHIEYLKETNPQQTKISLSSGKPILTKHSIEYILELINK